MNPAIAVDNVSFAYEESRILEHVNVTIAPGEFVGIFGPNGGGKTTFLKLLLGFLTPLTGTISLFGKPPKEARREIGYVPQIATFDKEFPITTLDVVLMGALQKLSPWGFLPKSVRRQGEEALEKVRLLHLKDRAFGSLSGGQAQRALLARALLSQPKLLLLDEPTASIDIEAEKEIYGLLNAVRGSVTILMVTHNLQNIVSQADRLLCIQRKVMPYSPKQVCEHFSLGLYPHA